MSINRRLAALEKKSEEGEERQPDSWHYLELAEDKGLSKEQRHTLKHNNAIDDAVCGFRYIETRAQVKYNDHAALSSDEIQ